MKMLRSLAGRSHIVWKKSVWLWWVGCATCCSSISSLSGTSVNFLLREHKVHRLVREVCGRNFTRGNISSKQSVLPLQRKLKRKKSLLTLLFNTCMYNPYTSLCLNTYMHTLSQLNPCMHLLRSVFRHA